MKKTAYLTYVRSGLEYSATIWDPHTDIEIDALEMVQHRAIRWICGYGPREECSITALRSELELSTLRDRRERQRLLLMYKVTHGEVAVPPSDLGLVTRDSRLRTGHEHCYEEKKARTDLIKFSRIALLTLFHNGTCSRRNGRG